MDKLSTHLSKSTVRVLRKMEETQSKEWIHLFTNMTLEQKIDYAKIKGIQQKEEEKLTRNNWSLKEWKEHEFTSRNLMVSRGLYPTIEDKLQVFKKKFF